jgi:hypothetical protein
MAQQVQAKPVGNTLFFWYPQPNDLTKKTNDLTSGSPFCDATPNSQGEDWFTKYVYEIASVNQVQKRLAYVECDYVQ